MSQLAQEKQVNFGTSARLNALSQYVLQISFSACMAPLMYVSWEYATRLGIHIFYNFAAETTLVTRFLQASDGHSWLFMPSGNAHHIPSQKCSPTISSALIMTSVTHW